MVLRSGLLRAVLRCAALFLLVMIVPAMLRAATPPVPSSPPERVIDLASIIEPALEAQLVSALRELEEKTTAQMVVLAVSALDRETIETVSLRTFMQWKLGQKGKDNGLLLTVALKERKYRFEAGYGLESVLPDSLLGSIGREKLAPFFKEGKYGEGIAAATKEMLAVLAKNYNVQLGSGIPLQLHHSSAPASASIPIPVIIFMAIWFILFINAICHHIKNRGKGGASSSSSSDSSWGSSDSSSSSSSDDSSSSSGFSGGGGESGGGGASGSW